MEEKLQSAKKEYFIGLSFYILGLSQGTPLFYDFDFLGDFGEIMVITKLNYIFLLIFMSVSFYFFLKAIKIKNENSSEITFTYIFTNKMIKYSYIFIGIPFSFGLAMSLPYFGYNPGGYPLIMIIPQLIMFLGGFLLGIMQIGSFFMYLSKKN